MFLLSALIFENTISVDMGSDNKQVLAINKTEKVEEIGKFNTVFMGAGLTTYTAAVAGSSYQKISFSTKQHKIL